MKILVADDESVSRNLLVTILSRHGSVETANDGEAALESFRRALESGRTFDLVCLDITMPKMDGQEVLREIRKLEEARGTYFPSGAKVIMTTASEDRENVIGAFRAQCEAYMVKPIHAGKLIEQLRKLRLIDTPT